MTRTSIAQPLTAEAFAPYGDVLDCEGVPDRIINAGLCERFHDRARLDFGPGGRAGLSVFNAQPRFLPYMLELLERHPDGSQAFIPMTEHPFLVVVADDADGIPGAPRAFVTNGHQGINFLRGTWHGVLTPLSSPGLFAVIDRIGTTSNLIEHRLEYPWIIQTT